MFTPWAPAQRCDGVICTKLDSGTTAELYRVWGSDPNNVYVVGDSGTVLQCGTGPTPCSGLTKRTMNKLTAAWGIDAKTYVVGDAGTVLRCQGKDCGLLKSNTLLDLLAVEGSDPNNVYAVGAGGTVVKCAAGSDSCIALTMDPAP